MKLTLLFQIFISVVFPSCNTTLKSNEESSLLSRLYHTKIYTRYTHEIKAYVKMDLPERGQKEIIFYPLHAHDHGQF